MTYTEKSTRVVLDSSIAVMVLLNRDATDMEFWMLKPCQRAPTPPEEFAARGLRCVGITGLCGIEARCALKEPLEPTVVSAIGRAFATYVSVLLGDNIQIERQDEVEWLRRLWNVPDTRSN